MARRKLAVLLALALLAGCGDYGDDVVDKDEHHPMKPPTTVSFADDIQPIFDANCIGCHGDNGNAGLDLRPGLSYTNLVLFPASESSLMRVDPGRPMQSWLYLKLTGRQDVGSEMPPGSPLDADTTELVRTWIEEGALDN